MRITLLALSIATFALTACNQQGESSGAIDDKPIAEISNSEEVATKAEPSPEEALAIYQNEAGLDLTGVSESVRPQDDLFAYMNQQWLADNPIPDDELHWGVIGQLRELSDLRQQTIIEEMANREALIKGSVEQIVGDYFSSLTDPSLVDGKGVESLTAELAQIDAIDSESALARAFGKANIQMGVSASENGATPIALNTMIDPGQEGRYIPYIWQSGLTLPNRDYYPHGDEPLEDNIAAIFAEYPSYIEKMFTLAGFDNGAERAQTIIAIETHLAGLHWAAERNRDIKAIYNVVATSDLAEQAPGFDWVAFMDGALVKYDGDLSASQLDYIQQVGSIVSAFSLEQWQDYLRFHLINDSASLLSQEFDDARFAFMLKKVYGLQQPIPDWRKAVRLINRYAGEAVGKVYVERYFPAEYKTHMATLVGNLMEAFRVGIEELDWMSDETKARAEAKRQALGLKIGYPDEWRDYSALDIRADDPVGNVSRGAEFAYRYEIAKLGKEIDRSEWGMTPQTVNAYHKPTLNEIVFPAAYLQPPNFMMGADDAANYGAIGVTIGHEIGHAFDDNGRHYGPKGTLEDWWTEQDAERFEAAAAKLVDQYNAFEPVPGMHINGKLTLGENIADLTGVVIAYNAYQASLGGKEAPVIDGLTGDQRFFLSYAQSERNTMREEYLRNLLLDDPHSPSEYRVLGILPNFDPFYAAFNVKEGDAMYLPPEERVKIW